MTTPFKYLLIAALLCGGLAFAGETNPPPTTVPGKTPVPAKPEIKTQPVTPAPAANPANELLLLLTDLKDGDAAKRDAAGKALATKGSAAHRSLTQFLNAADADLAKRAKDIRTQIEAGAAKLKDAAQALQDKAMSGPMTVAAFDDARKAWIAAAQAAPQRELQQNAIQGMQQMQQMMAQVDQWQKAIAVKDAELAATPAPGRQERAAIQLARAQSLNELNRFDDALKATQDAFTAGGRECRYAPTALRMQAELLNRKGDTAGLETLCKKIIVDYAESLEARFAYGALADMYTESKRWDEATEAVKKFIGACPLEEDAQTAADTLLDTLMDKERDFPRAYGLSTWIKQRLPISRVRPEVVKNLALCSEYAVMDLAKAEIAYKTLAADYADAVKASEIDAMQARVKAKIAGTFPKDIKAEDGSPAAALIKYIAAVRARDGKTLASLVPEAAVNEAVGNLTCESCDLVRVVTLADYVVKGAEVDGDKASISVDFYDSNTNTPRRSVLKAIKEKGAWKIEWTGTGANEFPAIPPDTKLPGTK